MLLRSTQGLGGFTDSICSVVLSVQRGTVLLSRFWFFIGVDAQSLLRWGWKKRLGDSAFWPLHSGLKRKKKIFAILTHYKSRSVDKLGGVSTLKILVAFYSWNWLIRIIACYVCVWVCVCMYVYFSGGFLFFLNYSWHTIEPLYFRIGQDLRDNILNILEQQSLDRFLLSQEFPEVPGEREKLRIQGSWFPLLLNQSISILTVLCIGVSQRFFLFKEKVSVL